MLVRLLSILTRRGSAVIVSGAVEPAAIGAVMPAFPPMVPLQPPSADNDDDLARLSVGIERELRAAGYLH